MKSIKSFILKMLALMLFFIAFVAFCGIVEGGISFFTGLLLVGGFGWVGKLVATRAIDLET